jgi:hypothetical protein
MRYPKTFYSLRSCMLGTLLICSIGSPAQNGIAYGDTKGKTPAWSNNRAEDTNDQKTLFTVLKELNKKRGVYFLFSEEGLSQKLVNPVIDDAQSIEKILDAVLKNTGLKYKKVSENTFVILNDKEKFRNAKDLQQVNFEGSGIKKQEEGKTFDEITGRITDSKGDPLSGVSITVKGTNKGTATNTRGEFSIDASKGDILVVSYVGYEKKEITIGNSNNIAISLNAADQQLTEVVVTALGIKKEKKALGYSVTEVKGNELTQAREVNVANSLVGKVAGVNVSSVSGGPGSSTSVIIRGVSSLSGQNQPL